MSKILINENIEAEGELSFSHELVNEKIISNGVMALNMYIEEINSIYVNHFAFNDVSVTKEMLGTNDTQVVYNFSAIKTHIDVDNFNKSLKGSDK